MRQNPIPNSNSGRFSRYVIVLAVLLFLFLTRVLGQALQHWMPQSFLPAEHAFQGSNLPYWLLLGVQLILLALMARVTWRVHTRELVPCPRAATLLGWAGGIYMSGSLARLAIGVGFPASHPWFRTWIPAVFHIVLAGFVLTLCLYHQYGLHHSQGKK